MKTTILLYGCLFLLFHTAFGQEPTVEKSTAASPSQTSTSAPEDLLKELLLMAAGTEQGGSDEQADARNTFSTLSQIRNAISDRQWRSASQMAESSSRNMQSTKYRKMWDGLADSLRKTGAAEMESLIPQAKALVMSLPKRLTEATTSSQATTILSDLKKSQSRLQVSFSQGSSSEETREYSEQLSNAVSFVKRFEQYLIAKESADDRGRNQIAQELIRSTHYDARWRSAIRTTVETSLTADAKALDDRFKAVAKQVEQAKSAEEITTLSAELQKISNQRREVQVDFSNNDDSIPAQISQLSQWKEILNLESEQRYRSAVTRLESFGTMNRSLPLTNPIITREMLQNKSAELAAAIAKRGGSIFDPAIRLLAEQLDKVEDISSLRTVTKGMNSENPRNRSQDNAEDRGIWEEMMTALDEGNSLVAMDESIAQRNWDKFWNVAQSRNHWQGKQPHRWSRRFEQIRLEMIRRWLKDSKEYKDLKLTEKEPLDVELLANVEQAMAAKDFRKSYLFLQLYQRVIYPTTTPQWLLNELVAIQFLAQAESFDLAGDTLEAGRRYRTVILYPSSRIPMEAVQNRLKEILAKHPELAQENTQAGIPSPSTSLRNQQPPIGSNPFDPR